MQGNSRVNLMTMLRVVLLVLMFMSGPGTLWSEPGLDTAAKVVKKIEFHVSEDGSEVVSVFLDGFHTPKIFSLNSDNPRIVCDFIRVKPVPSIAPRYDFSGKLLRAVRVAYHSTPSSKLRVVLDLARDVRIDVSPYFFKKERIFALTLSQSGTTAP
jgi:hypothetical protein